MNNQRLFCGFSIAIDSGQTKTKKRKEKYDAK